MFLDFILPPRCIVTGEIVDRQSMLSPAAWQSLNFITDPFCEICGVPDDVNLGDGSQIKCFSCEDKKPKFDKARAIFRYDDASRPLVLGFKHGDKTYLAQSFAKWLHMAGEIFLKDEAALLIPVPLHWTRLFKRRYNQSALLAAALSKNHKVPVCHQALKRVRATPFQGQLTASQRRKNMKSAFSVPDKYKPNIKDKTVILIDDVLTSGATVNECAKVLKVAGAKKVFVLCLARVSKPTS